MSQIYKKIISILDQFVPQKFQPFWQHPAGRHHKGGPKTVFFWAPTFKWGLVIAGIGDLKRPPEKLSLAQCSALMATGTIWSRYSMVIIPKNWNLFSVNVFVAATALYQVVRILRYQYGDKLEESSTKVTGKK